MGTPTRNAKKVIAEIEAATSAEQLNEIETRPMPWIDRAMTDDVDHIRQAITAAREELVD